MEDNRLRDEEADETKPHNHPAQEGGQAGKRYSREEVACGSGTTPGMAERHGVCNSCREV